MLNKHFHFFFLSKIRTLKIAFCGRVHSNANSTVYQVYGINYENLTEIEMQLGKYLKKRKNVLLKFEIIMDNKSSMIDSIQST